jgi:hypothetical protein
MTIPSFHNPAAEFPFIRILSIRRNPTVKPNKTKTKVATAAVGRLKVTSGTLGVLDEVVFARVLLLF